MEVGKGDGKVYTFIIKDEEPVGPREDGREKAGVNWEVEFRAGGNLSGGENGVEEKAGVGDGEGEEDRSQATRVWIPWESFQATYRGKEKKDAGEMKRSEVRRLGFMMRRSASSTAIGYSCQLTDV